MKKVGFWIVGALAALLGALLYGYDQLRKGRREGEIKGRGEADREEVQRLEKEGDGPGLFGRAKRWIGK